MGHVRRARHSPHFPMLNLKTPGVYVSEIGAFPNSVVPVATAIPAFIGYTARASYAGKSCIGQPVQITSLQEYAAYFSLLDPATGQPLPDIQQYAPVYYPVPAKNPLTADITLGGKPYDIEPDPGTVYYLYNSIKLFYQNGGGTCYVLSVGTYGSKLKHGGKAKSAPLVNPNVDATALTAALGTLETIPAVTMIVIPDAMLLKAADNAGLAQQTLLHCQKLQSRVALLDVLGGDTPNPQTWETDDIAPFRTAVGLQGLGYGVSYYPFLKTGVLVDSDLNYANLGGATALSAVLTGATAAPLKTTLSYIGESGPGIPTPAQIENTLLNTSSDYLQLHNLVLEKMNVLPPSAAMAGVYTMVDTQSGVWQAPANVSLVNVVDTTLRITDAMQAGLNVDAATGKSINAIRLFPGKGVIVWGARTLDGNSQDWRYVNVRRTMIMLEQSMILAVRAYTFQPNVANTWSLVTSMLDNFLTAQWSAGALAGATPAAAFSVACGLGSTMTAQDILNGFMNISVKVAISHPAEFIVINIQQQMESAS